MAILNKSKNSRNYRIAQTGEKRREREREREREGERERSLVARD